MIKISVETPEGLQLEQYNFDRQSVMIGRAEANDISLVSDDVSRYHARLSISKGIAYIFDLESTNGTFLNGVRVSEAVVTSSDSIFIGGFILRVIYTEVTHTEASLLDQYCGLPNKDEALRSTKSSVLFNEAQELVDAANDTIEPNVEQTELQEDQTNLSYDARVSQFYWDSLKSFLGPVWPYLTDDSISEVLINGPREIFVESRGRLSRLSEQISEAQLDAAVLNIAQFVGRRVSNEEPYLDARLPDGSRVAVLLPPCSRKGAAIAIRKFSKECLTLESLVGFGSLTKEMLLFLKACVVLRKNIVVSGGTSSGKTSLLNLVSGLVPQDERIITIEDAAELQLNQDHVLPMETKPPNKKGQGQITIRDLVRVSLRMRPDRIIVGEIRGGEALDLLQAMNTGHSGSMATVHASSPRQALTRLETLSLFSGIEIPIRALREQVASAIDIVIQTSRLPDHSRKVTHISEVVGTNEDGSYIVKDLFKFMVESTQSGKIIGNHKMTGEKPEFLSECELTGLADVAQLFS